MRCFSPLPLCLSSYRDRERERGEGRHWSAAGGEGRRFVRDPMEDFQRRVSGPTRRSTRWGPRSRRGQRRTFGVRSYRLLPSHLPSLRTGVNVRVPLRCAALPSSTCRGQGRMLEVGSRISTAYLKCLHMRLAMGRSPERNGIITLDVSGISFFPLLEARSKPDRRG